MEIRTITDEEIGRYRKAIMETFGGDPDMDPTGDERFRALLDGTRVWAAFDRGNIVATAAAFALDLVVPGGSLPMAGLTMVTVRPSHRRRGILRALMAEYLADERRRGEPIGGLWASEGTIYGRFGFGLAAEGDSVSFYGPGLTVADGLVRDDVDIVDADVVASVLPDVFARSLHRPGMYARTQVWWEQRRFQDRPDLRKGASQRRHAVSRRGDVATGYVAYRQRSSWENGLANGTVEIDEMVATDARAEATLWRFVAEVDLFPNVTWSNAPTDSILPWIASDWRQIRRRRTDTLWLRLDDVAACLAARRYLVDGKLRLAVADPEGTTVWSLEVERGVGRCTRGDEPADLRLSRSALGTIYLGGTPASLLGRAGRIVGEPEPLLLADRMFGWPMAPWCDEMF